MIPQILSQIKQAIAMAVLATISIAFALFFLVCASAASGRGRGGFTIDLIHRDSPRSPFYNSSETPSQRLSNAFRRSLDRLSHFNPPTGSSASSSVAAQLDQPESTIIKSRGEYLMELSIGTPPFPIKAIADTGSDLIWTQCKPCIDCYNQTDPIFDPSNSSTYQTIACPSNQCKSNTLQLSCSSDSACQYNESYLGKSHTIGDYAFDTVTLASTTGTSVPFPNTLIGCGHDNEGTYKPQWSGIVGLGGGDESLISQLGTSIDGKFSYCLLPYTSQDDQTSKLSFGNNAVVSGSGVVSTPIVQRQSLKTFFFLKLEAISVDDTKIPFSSSSSSSGQGNIVIDSGTTFTRLEQPFYSELEDAVDKVVGRERVIDPQGKLPPLCYKVSASEDFKTPNIIVHFSGADVKLEPNNAFLRLNEDIVCFTFAPSEISIYGNVAQSGFLVGYDLKGKTVSFKPADCTNF